MGPDVGEHEGSAGRNLDSMRRGGRTPLLHLVQMHVALRERNRASTLLDLVQRCKEALEAGGCSIPFPQRDVHLMPADAGLPKQGA